MPIDFDYPILKELRAYCLDTPEYIVPFVGAGLSVPVGLPTWPRLIERLAERARMLQMIDQPEKERPTQCESTESYVKAKSSTLLNPNGATALFRN
jgi:hypothetical protein